MEPIVTGVYLTTLGPEEGKTALSVNNWGGRGKIKQLEAYIKITMNENDPNLTNVSQKGRKILLYTGDIKLENYPGYEVVKFN